MFGGVLSSLGLFSSSLTEYEAAATGSLVELSSSEWEVLSSASSDSCFSSSASETSESFSESET